MKVGIVGAGMVGSAAAYAIGLRGVASEVVLVDHNPAMARAHALDIAHAMPFGSGTVVSSGDHNALEGAGVVIIADIFPDLDPAEHAALRRQQPTKPLNLVLFPVVLNKLSMKLNARERGPRGRAVRTPFTESASSRGRLSCRTEEDDA